MILYLDASALVKRYVEETGTAEVAQIIESAEAVATSIISRAEVIAALAKAIRAGVLERDDAVSAAHLFRGEWQQFIRIQATETLIARADSLAWEHGLRGYDSVQLASAVIWSENMEQSLILATFDRQLWRVANNLNLSTMPSNLDNFLSLS